MSKLPHLLADTRVALPGNRSLKFNLDWITRPLFGVVLAAVAIGSIAAGAVAFAAVTSIAAVAAAREWQRMVGQKSLSREFFASAVAIVAALFVTATLPVSPLALAIVVAGALVVYVSAPDAQALWRAGGVLYIGVPSLLIIALRATAPAGAWLVIGLMLAVWATDTGALIAGNLIGGPKLAPVLSPNKTWAGTLGGIAIAAIVESIYVGILGGNIALAALYAVMVAIAAHAGDLFESWVKRRFRIKDSGGLIPGHGGVLDRVDSTLAAGALVAILVLAFGFDPLFGGHP